MKPIEINGDLVLSLAATVSAVINNEPKVRTGKGNEYLNRSFVHFETVVCLSNKNGRPKDYVEIGVDAVDYYNIKSAEKDV